MNPLMRVLVVDDDPGVRKLFKRVLAPPEFLIAEAATLAEARVAVASERVDLMICDVTLPDGDGLDFMAELKSGPLRPKTVVLTGAPTDEVQTRARQLGAGVVSKPIPIAELLLAVERAEQGAKNEP